MQAISFKVVYALVESFVDHLKNGYSHFCFVCLFFFTILQSATAIVFNLENDDFYTNKSEQSLKIHILN